MFCLSQITLFGAVLFVPIGYGALASASDDWTPFLVTVVALLIATVGASGRFDLKPPFTNRIIKAAETEMTLTNQQRHAVCMGEPVTVEIDGAPCVLIRKDVYEKSRKIIDFSEMPPEEAYAAIEAAWGDDPGLDAYQDLK